MEDESRKNFSKNAAPSFFNGVCVGNVCLGALYRSKKQSFKYASSNVLEGSNNSFYENNSFSQQFPSQERILDSKVNRVIDNLSPKIEEREKWTSRKSLFFVIMDNLSRVFSIVLLIITAILSFTDVYYDLDLIGYVAGVLVLIVAVTIEGRDDLGWGKKSLLLREYSNQLSHCLDRLELLRNAAIEWDDKLAILEEISAEVNRIDSKAYRKQFFRPRKRKRIRLNLDSDGVEEVEETNLDEVV